MNVHHPLLDVSYFDTNNVVDMGYMFNSCQSLTSLNVSNFTTSNVQRMSCMFEKCYNLSNLYLGPHFSINEDCLVYDILNATPIIAPYCTIICTADTKNRLLYAWIEEDRIRQIIY